MLLTTLPAYYAALPKAPPNVVIILADDLGYSDIGCYGAKDILTPNIDRLATEGMKMTAGYVSAPVCGPSRAGLMTGMSQNRFGFEFNLDEALSQVNDWGLPPQQVTIAEYMKSVGYQTGMVGKWHLGMRPGLLPNSQGFDYFFGFREGGSGYMPNATVNMMRTIYENHTPVPVNQYLTDEFTDRAVDYIDGHSDAPFFLYLAYNAPHHPLQTTAKYRKRYPNLTGKRQTLAGMISAMDDGVGQVRAALRRNRVSNNTLVVFLSDNGGVLKNTSTNDPWRGSKTSVWEGGFRVPFIMSLPNTIPAGSVYDKPISSMDLLPTALALGGGQAPLGIDGVDVMSYILGTNPNAPHDALYWKYGERKAIREGDLKVMKQDTRFAWTMRDLNVNPQETTDYSAAYSDFPVLQAHYLAWEATLPPPTWGNGGDE
jgi:arylsulfatase A-like enzyme